MIDKPSQWELDRRFSRMLASLLDGIADRTEDKGFRNALRTCARRFAIDGSRVDHLEDDHGAQ